MNTYSMTTPHPFSTSRESILGLWSPEAQTRRSLPEAHTSDLFVLLHGMLFTNIQLDDFQPTLSRFLERLQIQGAEERDWIMMGIINTASLFEYGRPTGVLYQISGINTNAVQQQKLRVIAKKEEKKDADWMDVDGDMDETKMISTGTITQSPKMNDVTVDEELPVHLRLSLQLTFAMLAQTLKNPTRKSLLHGDTLNPYITIVLTFLSIVMKSEFSTIFERVVPWKELAEFLSSVPRAVLKVESKSTKDPALLTTGCSPLPEDACLRGMAWGGRKIYERGFWFKSSDGAPSENEVLDKREVEDLADGIIEDDEDETNEGQSVNERIGRWTRVFRAGVKIAKYVDGFGSVLEENGKRTWKVSGVLAAKVERWQEQERREREEEELQRNRKRWDDSMDIDDDIAGPSTSDDSDDDDDDDENDSEAVKALKVSVWFKTLVYIN
jgi:protein SMG6